MGVAIVIAVKGWGSLNGRFSILAPPINKPLPLIRWRTDDNKIPNIISISSFLFIMRLLMLSCLYHFLIEQHSLDQGERICAGWGLIKGNGGDSNIRK